MDEKSEMWLGYEIEDTLATAAEAVPVPQPQWCAVGERLHAGQGRRVRRNRSLALAAVAVAICLTFCVSNFLAPPVAAQVPEPEMLVIPTPSIVVLPDVQQNALSLASTPSECYSTSSSTPVWMPLPVPGRLETRMP